VRERDRNTGWYRLAPPPPTPSHIPNSPTGLDELQALMRDTYGEDYRSRAGPRALEDSLCEKDLAGNPLSASVTIERFAVAMQNAPSVLAAAFHLQRALRTRFLGNAFWEKLTCVPASSPRFALLSSSCRHPNRPPPPTHLTTPLQHTPRRPAGGRHLLHCQRVGGGERGPPH